MDKWGSGMEIASLGIFNNVSYFPVFCCPVPLTLVVFLIPDYFPWTSDYHCFCLPFDLVSFYFSVSLIPICLCFFLTLGPIRLLISLSCCPFIYSFTSPWYTLQSTFPSNLPRPIEPTPMYAQLLLVSSVLLIKNSLW